MTYKYEFRELECDDSRGMGWISRDGIDIASVGAMELWRDDNLRIAQLFVDAGNGSLVVGMAKLDQAWAEINALGGVIDRTVPYDVGYDSAIGKALEIIEKLGGMDPAERSKE